MIPDPIHPTSHPPQRPVHWFQFDVPTAYGEIEQLQNSIFKNKLSTPHLSDGVIACQHFPVITLGRRTKPEHLRQSQSFFHRQGIEVHSIVRGGSVTAHEPGQLVFYPILNLSHYQLDVMVYIRTLTQWMIDICADLGLACSDRPTSSLPHPEGTYLTGIWAGQHKIASIGIRVQKSITMHGVAININNDCEVFQQIAPCGMEGIEVRSIKQLTGQQVDLSRVMLLARKHFESLFRVTTESIDEHKLLSHFPSGKKYGQEDCIQV